ncbi:glycosyltransferase 87 family protein [Streptoalloteichus hindustanus]|uniref:Alpha-1,2-mannosyltransferase n=1 Tax=Streptoalloteichus hindustanus TaxID=2017 RepID=A0A1M5GY74_STRHI|nr:glycosyltransferase 87 family protein [Streptoalloteichus hindustanus]SHG08432.1 alpha-1,2-mannosyltransferase [Streptoalloteichus hindustanus]
MGIEGRTGASARARRVVYALVAGAAVVALAFALTSPLIDAQVYRGGVEVWLSGQDVYRASIPTSGVNLPFTYPPFAMFPLLVLFTPPLYVGAALLTLLGVAALFAACLLVARRLDVDPGRALLVAAGATLVGTLSEPLRGTLQFGQINLLLLGLVAVDCLSKNPRWPRGVLIGVAAAIKLTPAGFLLFFAARRQWRPVFAGIASFAVCTGLAWAVMPSGSTDFWFRAVLDPSRVGGLAYAGNQSLRGVLERFDLPGSTGKLLWLVLAAVVVVVAALVAHRTREDEHGEVTAWFAVAAAALLISPVSWDHHWVYAVPFVLALGYWAAAHRQRLWAPVLAGALFLFGLHWLLPREQERERQWALWQHLPGDSFVLVALVGLGVAFVMAHRRRPASRPAVGENPEPALTAP